MPQWTDVGYWKTLPLLQSIGLNEVEREESIVSIVQIYFYSPKPYSYWYKDTRWNCMPYEIVSVKNGPTLAV